MARSVGSALPEWIALTGTPGVGKSTVARHLSKDLPCVEVGELAAAWGAARGHGRSIVVDLPKLSSRLPVRPTVTTLIVGALSHELPVQRVILLRCHPLVLRRRLARRRGPEAHRAENVEAEAIDLVRAEAERLHGRTFQIDTTRLRAGQVARKVLAFVRRRTAPRETPVDWLADPAVTEHLLRDVP